jgi:hypothetical protein
MAKMISKFHVLIQSRMVWIVFVVLVVVSFILLPVAANFGNSERERDSAPGMLEGKPVPREEYAIARSNSYLGLMMMALMYGQDFQFNDEVSAYVDDVAWKRLVTLRKAEELGFEAFDSEVAEYIRSVPLFSPEGSFSPNVYAFFKDQYLASRGFTGADFERYAAEEVALQKVQRMVSSLGIVSPRRVEQSVDILGAQFKVDYTVLPRAALSNEVAVSEADAREVYEENPESFMQPGKIDLKYVYLKYDDFRAQVAQPGQEELEDYYNNNLDQYLVADTNEVAEDESQEESYRTFNEVKAEIEQKLIADKSQALATDAANAMVFELPPDRNGRAKDFAAVAAEMGLSVQDLEPFSIGSQPALDDGAELVAQEADQLRPNPDEYFSDAIPASEGVYVLALEERSPEFVAPYEDVKEDALELARRRNLELLLDERISALRTELEQKLSAGASFADAVSAAGLEASTSEAFTAQNAAQILPPELNVQALSEQIVFLNQGELSDPIMVGDGRMLACVAERQSPAAEGQGNLADMIYQSMRNDAVARIFDDWQEHLLAAADFEDLTDRVAAGDTEED